MWVSLIVPEIDYNLWIWLLMQDEDMFGDPNFLGQAMYPIKCLRQGMFGFNCKVWCNSDVLLLFRLSKCDAEEWLQRRSGTCIAAYTFGY